MTTDLASFLAPESLIGTISQRVCEFLSVQDLVQYVASAAATPAPSRPASGAVECGERAKEPINTPDLHLHNNSKRYTGKAGDGGHQRDRRAQPADGDASANGSQRTGRKSDNEQGRSSRRNSNPRSSSSGKGGSGRWREVRVNKSPPPEEDVPKEGGGDEAGGSARTHTPRLSIPHQPAIRTAGDGQHDNGCGNGEADGKQCDVGGGGEGGEGTYNVFGVLLGLGLQPWVALGMIGGGVSNLLRGVPLFALLRWAASGASSVLGVTFRVALLPYDVTRGVVSYVVGALEAMLNVATEIWCELRHLSLGELAYVVSCVVSGNSIPECLLPPLGTHDGCSASGGSGGGGSSGGGVLSGRGTYASRLHSRSSVGSESSLDSEGVPGLTSGYSEGGRNRSASSRQSDDARSGVSGSRGAWRQAHALRRRLDRVNKTASLVSYEERAQSGVPRAKAQRVRRRMHYAMSLQCFQATVTVDGRDSPHTNDGGWADDDSCGSDSRGGAGMSSSGPFMCTPQSFPPTPVSRAHVMARTSQFADDILFLARDQLRLGENLKAGVDETTRATADFLRRQQRLAVLDGNNACEGITLTCGHHCATKIGPSLYSSVRAMVPVLRNRHVYFQVSCKREGPLAPCIGVGLSTPEMPLSTLVGAFSNSVGLCSTGQVLMSSRWYGLPGEYAVRKTSMSTVGVLVYLDGSRSFRSWDGDMVRALVCFSVDGRLVRITPTAAPTATTNNTTSHRHKHQHHAHSTAPAATITAAAIAANGGAEHGVTTATTTTTATFSLLKANVVPQTQRVLPPPPPPPLVQPLATQLPTGQPPSSIQQGALYGTSTSAAALPVGPEAGPEAGVGVSLPASMAAGSEVQSAEEVAPWEPAAMAAAATTAVSAGVGQLHVDSRETAGWCSLGGVRGVGGVNQGAVVVHGAPTAAAATGELRVEGMAERGGSASAALGLALPKDRDLFPTVTIHSGNTEVLCRFCAEDLLAVTRDAIGAPPGVPVYALDGSLINLR